MSDELKPCLANKGLLLHMERMETFNNRHKAMLAELDAVIAVLKTFPVLPPEQFTLDQVDRWFAVRDILQHRERALDARVRALNDEGVIILRVEAEMLIRKQKEDPFPIDKFYSLSKNNPFFTREQVARMFELIPNTEN